MLSGNPRRIRFWFTKRLVIFLFVCSILCVADLFNNSRYKEYTDDLTDELLTPLGEHGLCPNISNNPYLIGALPTDIISNEKRKEEEVIKMYPELKQGGQWTPNDCHTRFRIAIIIPYRDRKSHLARFLAYLIPVLQRQRLDFRFIVTEQSDRIPYACTPKPFHLGAFVDTLGYKLVGDIAGGVTIISMKHYKRVNGHSNLYWGWGAEDDDMRQRINTHDFKLQRPDSKSVRFTMMSHVQRQWTSQKYVRHILANATERMATDGLDQALWNVTSINIGPLYHHLFVDVGKAPEEWRLKKNSAFFNSLFFVFLLILVFNI